MACFFLITTSTIKMFGILLKKTRQTNKIYNSINSIQQNILK